jgi:hypothetical protein
MTTQELHIALDILLQKVNSNWNKNFLPQEKDLLINREVTKFIKQRINPRSNNKQLSVFDVLKRTQDLNNLIKNSYDLDVVHINEKEAYFELPFSYLSYINSEVKLRNSCSTDTNNNSTTNTVYKVLLNPVKIFNTLTNLKIQLVRNTETITIFDLNNLPTDYLPQDNISDYKKTFIINNAINILLTEYFRNTNIEFTFNNLEQKFIFKSKENFSIIYTINSVIQNTPTSTSTSTGYNIDKYFTSPIRIVDEEYKSEINKSYLSSSSDDSITGYLESNRVIIVKPKNTVVSKVNLTYFCKPRKVDLLLNINSNFSNEILEEIIDNTAKTMKGIISSDTYEKFSNENLLIE